MFQRFLILASVALLSCSCRSAGSAPPPENLTELLWLPEDAHIEPLATGALRVDNGRHINIDGSRNVLFTIESDPDELSNGLIAQMASLGWDQRRTQSLNPQLESVGRQLRGYASYLPRSVVAQGLRRLGR